MSIDPEYNKEMQKDVIAIIGDISDQICIIKSTGLLVPQYILLSKFNAKLFDEYYFGEVTFRQQIKEILGLPVTCRTGVEDSPIVVATVNGKHISI